jgi:hypothetical protein
MGKKGGGWLVFNRPVSVRGGDRRRPVGSGAGDRVVAVVLGACAHAAGARTRGFRLPV